MPVRSLYLLEPDRKDMERFPYKTVRAGEECFEFYEGNKTLAKHIKVNDWTSDLPVFVDLETLMKSHSVRSFLLIKSDSILFEYTNWQNETDDLHSSYSIAKSFMSTLIGIAIDEGKIPNVQTLAKNYLPELAKHKESEILSIEHLLNHTSGIKNNLSLDAIIYYGKDIYKAFDQLKFEADPGTKQAYSNMSVQLLGIILQRATQKTPTQYLEEKIWQPIQMCSDAIWSVDEENKLEKTYCCLGATAYDYAKLGRLYLNKGKWNERQIFSETWYNKAIRRDTLNGSSYNYNYCWHIGLKEYGDFMANGKYKQHIYINPEKQLIFVLLNNKESKMKASLVNWWDVFRQIADQL